MNIQFKGDIMLVNRPQKEEAKSTEQQTLEVLKAIDQKLYVITAIVVVTALIAIIG